MFDIVIPVGPNDSTIINEQLNYTKKNIIGYRNIYLIYNGTLEIPGCITIQESSFPFTIHTVERIHGKLSRNGWYLQQLLKLYAGLSIPGILDTYLVLDSDTFFLKPTTFMKDGICLYNFGLENHTPYFDHISKLHPSFKKIDQRSGICHHMMFQTKYIKEVFTLVESLHQEKFYTVFLNKVTNFTGSGASEYELYFNYMIQNHPNEIQIRPLRWQNVRKLSGGFMNDYESVHWYMRN
jgi:hypothetical protein